MALVRTGRILVVDNDPHFRSSLEILLEAKGYKVFATGTQIEARHVAIKERIHVAVLDVRMESDLDHDDMSGLNLARQLDPVIVKIMLTAYPSLTAMRRSTFGDVPAVNFVFKDEGPKALLEALTKAFADNVGLNFDLVIRWQGVELKKIAGIIELERREAAAVIESEVEEVLCKLFKDAEEIIIAPLIAPPSTQSSISQSGAVIIKVTPRYPGGWAPPVVVKLASRQKIEVEARNYRDYVEHYIDGFRRTQLQGQTQSHLLGGLIYTLVGTPLEQCTDLTSFYQTHTAHDIIQTLRDIFMRTCRHWYENQGARQRHDLMTLYGDSLKLSVERLIQSLRTAELENWAGEENPTVPEIKRAILNPVEWLRQQATLASDISLCYTHGDLHGRNVLVDQNNQAWLIDFYRSGEGHMFRDIIQLESDVKFVLLEMADLRKLYQFEAYLLNAKYFDDRPTLPSSFREPELRKAFEVVQGIRYIAGKLIGVTSSMLDYYQGLYLQTLAIINLRHITPQKKRHAYLAASLLCERLERW